jgi:hypothetical protein
MKWTFRKRLYEKVKLIKSLFTSKEEKERLQFVYRLNYLERELRKDKFFNRLRSEINSIERMLKEIEEALPKISEVYGMVKISELSSILGRKRELSNPTEKYKSLASNLKFKVGQLYEDYNQLDYLLKLAREQFNEGHFDESFYYYHKYKWELSITKKDIGKVEKVTEKIVKNVRCYTSIDVGTIVNILTKYKGTSKWDEFKELLTYSPDFLQAVLVIGTDVGYEPSELLPFATAYSLKTWDKKNGKPPSEIVKYKINPNSIKEYIIKLSNQSSEAGDQINYQIYGSQSCQELEAKKEYMKYRKRAYREYKRWERCERIKQKMERLSGPANTFRFLRKLIRKVI